jgi:hypothetical protein
MSPTLCSADSPGRLAKLKFLLPPSGLKPASMATASISVDLRLPFSPIRKVTCGSNRGVSSARIAGMENGYWSKDATRSRSSVTLSGNPVSDRAPGRFFTPAAA